MGLIKMAAEMDESMSVSDGDLISVLSQIHDTHLFLSVYEKGNIFKKYANL